MISASKQSRGKSIRHPDIAYAKSVRKKVRNYIIYILLFLIMYVLFFSTIFQIKYIEIIGNQAINTEEIEKLIWQELDTNILLLFNRSNYWLLSINHLLKNIGNVYSFENITITKKFPNILRLQVIERLGRLIWQTQDKYYVLDGQGIATRQLREIHLIEKTDIPVILDTANQEVIIGDKILNDDLITNIIEATKIYEEYITNDKLSFKHIEIDSDDLELYKIITNSGIQIHLNDDSSAIVQLDKLKRVLDTQNIDLNGISYINLRIRDQVIYK